MADRPPLRRLTPGADLDVDGLAAAYAYPLDPPGGWWLRANMVSTVDGAAAAPDGVTRGISSDRDRDILALLRALADVILVGAGTAHKEGYGPEKVREAYRPLRAAAGQSPTPPIAVTTAKLDLDLDGPLFRVADPSARTILLTTEAAPPDRLRAAREVADVAIVGGNSVDPAAAVAALTERGHRRLLSEGGPHLLRNLVAAGVLDELCLTISGTALAGDTFRILNGPPLDDPPTLRLGHALSDGRDLFLRYVREPARA
jgi:riboflavin biosynthesis pyrimidine reductase